MARTTTGNAESLPDEVGRLIDRKLRLMRRQAEMRLGGIQVEMDQAVKTLIVDGLDAHKSKAAIHVGTLRAYRETVPQVVQITAEWPGAVWEAMEPILDRASIGRNHRRAIAGMLYSHAWRADELPWTAHWADAQHFAGTVHQVLNGYGLERDSSNPEFERLLSLESSKAHVGFANRGRMGLGDAEIALDEYLLAHGANESSPKGFAEDLEAKKARQVERHDSALDWRSSTVKNKAGATHDEPAGSTNNGQSAPDSETSEFGYTHYPNAMRILKVRLGTTPAELAVWVSLGDEPGCGGITAYLEANITANPRKLVFDVWSEADFDYLAPLMGTWFLSEDIASFQPADRFIEYPRLVERWQVSEQLVDVDAYIYAKVREDRLHEFHPVTGHSQLSLPDYEYARPEKETTLFYLADVEAIECDEGIERSGTTSPDLATVTADEASAPCTSRREARTRQTEAMHQAWRYEYRQLHEAHPDKGKRWCARKIARMELSLGRDAETIRRQLR
jgi:hypothetical protein